MRIGASHLLVDRPFAVSLTLASLVATHAALTLAGKVPNVWGPLLMQDAGSVQMFLYLGLGAVAAITAGFGGVIVTFIYQSASTVFRRFRRAANTSLRANSMAIITTALTAAALSLLAAIFAVSGLTRWAPWLFELGLALFTHGALRTMYLLHRLIDVVGVDDAAEVKHEDQKKIRQQYLRRASRNRLPDDAQVRPG